MFGKDRVRRWALENPQLATTLVSMIFFAGFAAATGDLANLDGASGGGTTGGTQTHQGP